jgi:hypothetical protein
MATVSEVFGTATVLVVTSLQSLANSATAGWQSALIDNTSALALDYELWFSLTTANTAPATPFAVSIYICPAHKDNGGTWRYTDGGTTTLPSGTQGTYTIATTNGIDLDLLATLSYSTTNMTLQKSVRLSSIYGQSMPPGFSIIIINNTGAALGTGCVVEYQTINNTVV